MGRVIHLRVFGPRAGALPELIDGFDSLVAQREWRADPPRLAHGGSRDLFSMEFFRHAAAAAARGDPGDRGGDPLLAAGFVRLRRDETDALALLFMLRQLSELLGVAATVRDPDNPIAKLRRLDLDHGVLPGGAPLEAVLVARPIFKRLPGAVIELYPPRALGSAFGTSEGADRRRRDWSFLVHGMRASAPGFFEAEAEAMRIYRGLRFLER